ncbi:MAG TPA: hypothetical protein EYP14_12950, partial [Planctomycetaceae bacterium]|nr:hypothetical protein [Planctomycetaceae bacterium]
MVRFCWMLLRFATAAWVGAASLFIVCAALEATCPDLDSLAKNTLILLHFPWYYAFGFVSLGLALASGLVCWSADGRTRRRLTVLSLVLAAALLLMIADYVFIYQPMVGMLDQPAEARPSAFQRYHDLSMTISACGSLLWLTAAGLAC